MQMKIIEKYSTSKKKIMILLLLTTLLFLLLSFSIYFMRIIQKSEQYNTDLYYLQALYLKINKNSEALLIPQVYNPEFYSTEITVYSSEFYSLIKLFDEKIETLKNNTRTTKFNNVNEIKKIGEDMDSYKTKVFEILTLKQKIGNQNNGIIKNISLTKKEIILIVQEQTFDSQIKEKIYELFNIEENFENSIYTTNLENFNRIYQDIYNNLISSDSNNLYNKYLYTKTLDYLSEFRSSFNLLVEKKIEIGLSETEGYLGKLLDIKKFSGINIDSLIVSIKTQNEFAIVKLYFFTITFSIIFISLFIFIIYRITSYYEKNISQIKEHIQHISLGEILEEMYDKSNVEFNTIYNQLFVISENIKAKAEFTDKIKKSEFDSQLNLLSDSDILGKSLNDLKNDLKSTEENANKLKNADDILDWKTLGLAKFGEVMRRNTENLQNLSKEVIRNLIEYVNAVQGGFYIYNDENQNNVFLELTAYYAFGKEKIANKQINLYEGLVGTCAVERHKFYFAEIPEDYIYMTSGFGQAKPKSLIILPLTIDKVVYGVIELSSLNPLKDYEIDFLEKLAEDIAITVSYVKINDETARFLKMSERQTRKLLRKQHEQLEQIQAEQDKYNALDKKLLKKEQVLIIKDELINEKTKEISRLNKLLLEKEKDLESAKNEIKNTQNQNEVFFNKTKKEKNELKNRINILESEIAKLNDNNK